MPIPITKKKWRATRPVSCKASGVGEACDEYVKYCPLAANLTTEEDIKKARDTVLALQMALRDALKKIKPKDKEKDATEELIEDWLKQIKVYQGTVAVVVKKESDDKKAEVAKQKEESDKKEEEYKKVLKGYGDRKDELLLYFQTASAKFDLVVDEAKKLVEQADQLAKGANAQPGKATQCIQGIQGMLDKVRPFQGILDKANKEALAKFDPHRAGSGPDSAQGLGLLEKDSKPYATVFTSADTLRKKMMEQAKGMKAHEDSIESSLEEAKLATMSEDQKLPGYLKIATDLQVKVRALTDRISTKGLSPKGILDTGKEYKEVWQVFVETVTGEPDLSKKPQAKVNAKIRAKQRYDQVKELEAGLKNSLVTAAQMAKRGIDGIPKPIQGSSGIREQIAGTTTALQEAKAYYERFVKARTDAEQPYLDALQAIDRA